MQFLGQTRDPADQPGFLQRHLLPSALGVPKTHLNSGGYSFPILQMRELRLRNVYFCPRDRAGIGAQVLDLCYGITTIMMAGTGPGCSMRRAHSESKSVPIFCKHLFPGPQLLLLLEMSVRSHPTLLTDLWGSHLTLGVGERTQVLLRLTDPAQPSPSSPSPSLILLQLHRDFSLFHQHTQHSCPRTFAHALPSVHRSESQNAVRACT